MIDFVPAIRRALNRPCRFDFIAAARMPKGRRPAWSRLERLRSMCAAGTLPNASQLAQQFNTSAKTINRDIATLREQFTLVYVRDEWRFQVFPKLGGVK